MQAGLVSILLLFAISCSKESPNNSMVSTAQTSDALVASSDEDVDITPITGNYTLNYAWGCGASSSTPMTVYSDGTWSIPLQGYTGQWVQGKGLFMFHFHLDWNL